MVKATTNSALFENNHQNPLDGVEEALLSNDWVYSRPQHDELAVHIHGKNCNYSLTFLWQEEFQALQFFCLYDMDVPNSKREQAIQAIHKINENIWLGHFEMPDIQKSNSFPQFRHTTLFRGMSISSGADMIADLIDIGVSECERHFNIFDLLARETDLNEDLLNLLTQDTQGQA
jgi:hypothetical protein